ncbi:DUF1450 domain-containing protein [Ammoniphilus sp. CFH 90114]|uniref:DUF1450 domain-containing protein n=1 Tax=Ammoniphilus sp. CFH 90114 TaxID=2493665 RepID=UPI00100FDCA5|nr:DUF1450 domain-containing protein [Ammoniphilus sp. CFH 90114]RXT08731.1 DUF1450 domain-containing protein [Ammoniphilus sp. CFH 90114]
MSNEFRICDECRMTNVKTLMPKLKKLDPAADIKMGCQSYCGIGYKKSFCIVNGKHVTALSEEELLEKVEKAVQRAARRQASTTSS